MKLTVLMLVSMTSLFCYGSEQRVPDDQYRVQMPPYPEFVAKIMSLGDDAQAGMQFMVRSRLGDFAGMRPTPAHVHDTLQQYFNKQISDICRQTDEDQREAVRKDREVFYESFKPKILGLLLGHDERALQILASRGLYQQSTQETR